MPPSPLSPGSFAPSLSGLFPQPLLGPQFAPDTAQPQATAAVRVKLFFWTWVTGWESVPWLWGAGGACGPDSA